MSEREKLGRIVRGAWVSYCLEIGDTKPSHIAPWEELSNADKEVDRRIGEEVAKHVRTGQTLDDMQATIGAWGDVTFPQSNLRTVTSHLEEEVQELINGIRQHEGLHTEEIELEAADVLLLLIHLAHKSGFSLFDAAQRKMAINRARRWNPTAEPGGHWKHVPESSPE